MAPTLSGRRRAARARRRTRAPGRPTSSPRPGSAAAQTGSPETGPGHDGRAGYLIDAVVEPGLLEVDDRGDLRAGAQDVRRAEVAVDKLRRTPVIWRAGDQRPQGIATRRWHLPASSVEPVSDPRRQRFRPSLGRADLTGARAGRKRVMKPGQDRAGGLHLRAVINAGEARPGSPAAGTSRPRRPPPETRRPMTGPGRTPAARSRQASV